jgi:hypothetical protein
MTTMLDMLSDTKRMAFGSLHDQINIVAQPYTAGSTEIVMDMDVSGITPGMALSGDLNVFYVRSIDVATNTVSVIPGFDNSPKKPMAVGDFIYIKPRVTDWYMFETMNQEILRLSTPEHGLYQIASWETIVDPTWQTYEFPPEAEDMIGMLRVRYRMPGSPDVWYDVPEKSYRIQIEDGVSRIRLLRNIPSGTDIKFLYKAPFHQAENLTDNVNDVCGLSATMVDIPTLGCLATLLRTTESRRGQVQQQGDARRASEVVAGSNLSIANAVERDHQMRIWEEAARLVSRIPLIRSL